MLKILFLGGCHVIGFKVGRKAGFPYLTSILLSEKLKQEVDILALPYLRFKDIDVLNEKIESYKPDLLILQLGNLEFSPKEGQDWFQTIINHIHKKVKNGGFTSMLNTSSSQLTKPSVASSGKLSPVHSILKNGSLPPEEIAPNIYACIPKNKITTNIWAYIKQTVSHTLLKNAGYPQIPLDTIEKNIKLFFKQATSYDIPMVVFTPFPSVEPQINLYRRLGMEQIIACASSYNANIIQTHPIFEKEDLFDYYLDLVHLNAQGHSRIAHYLYNNISETNILHAH